MRYLETAVKIGKWLESQNYTGPDVCSHQSQVCSSSLAFSVRGWLNLYHHTGSEDFLKKAITCATWILALQKPDGSWPFPWPFRRNLANHSFACETMFTALALLELYLVTSNEKYLNSTLNAKQFLIATNGYHKLAEDSYCLWYSATDKVRIPNLGAIAGHLFSKLYLVTSDPEDLHLAAAFTNYCISAQRPDGSSLYWFPPADLSLQPEEDYSHDLHGRGRHPLDLHSFCYIPYHSLTIFEVDKAYGVTRSKLYQQYSLQAAEFLDSIMSDVGSVSEMITKKEWNPRNIERLTKIYSPRELLGVGYRMLSSKLLGREQPLCTAKNIAWTAKAFLAVSRYQPKFSSSAEKVLGYLVDNFVDADDGGVMYKLYSLSGALKSDKFVRGTSIVFESMTSFLRGSNEPSG